jgi:phage gp37-like protein
MAKINKKKLATGIGAGLLAAGAVAAAGYYFYGSKDAKKHRDAASKWAVDMKKQVVSKAKKLKNIDAQDFAGIVDTVMKTYQGVKSINPTDLKNAAKELKANWKMVQAELKKAGSQDVSRAKVVAKRSVASGKKTIQKVSAKKPL